MNIDVMAKSYFLPLTTSDIIEVDTTHEGQAVLQTLRDCGGVLAVLSATDAGFYRSVGALMGFSREAIAIGSLSLGCVEADLALHVEGCLKAGRPKTLRYGRGSPFFDIVLPCGGGIEIRIAPIEHPSVLDATLADMANRRPANLAITGLPSLVFRPDPRIVMVGDTPETAQLYQLARAAGFDVMRAADLDSSLIDARTAIAIMHHDHERATAQLCAALDTPAFWIGALGSKTTQAKRLDTLRELGCSAAELDRVRGPIGLIAHAREPKTLAVSVLADIVQAAQ